MSIPKATSLLDILEIGKRKYTDFRHPCKSENIQFPAYSKISQYRSDVILANEIGYFRNEIESIIGVGLSYRRILEQTVQRLFDTLPPIVESHYPLSIKVADGLDGSGSHQLYNQFEANVSSTKQYIIFGSKIVKVTDVTCNTIWSNEKPNSTVGIRPVALIAEKENEANIKHIMQNLINPEDADIELKGFNFANGHINISVIRAMFDGKMSAILSGAGGDSCQLFSATFSEL